ncbi:ABC transporter substrate-binding protein [Cohnella hongkongensis]|uniref:ABC transporter substrate-binding protein n=1 Tax=Cohnella hongkongensis TaxID=178337 RepID=A0ABV9FCS0_9BACL
MLKREKVGIIGILLLSIGLILSACGDGRDTAPSASQSSAEAPPASAAPQAESAASPEPEDQALRPFETGKGTIQIPAKPQRVVTDYYGGELLAAGLNVLGVEPLTFNNPFLADDLKEAEDVGEPLNIEKILELDPDLIVVMNDTQYEALSKIAPTVHIPYNTAKNVYETIKLFSELAGAPDNAERLIEEFDQKARKAREALQGIVDEKATIGIYELVNDGSFWIFGDNAGRGGQVFYNALGFGSPHPDKEGEQTLQLSMEMLPEYDADYMFLTVYDPDKTGEALRKLQESAIWSSLPAVKNNRLFINDFDTWYPYDPLAISGQIDLAVELLTQREAENAK